MVRGCLATLCLSPVREGSLIVKAQLLTLTEELRHHHVNKQQCFNTLFPGLYMIYRVHMVFQERRVNLEKMAKSVTMRPKIKII